MNRAFLLSLLVLAGCGLSNGKLLKDLDEGDATKLCEEQDPGSYTCDLGNGVTYTFEFGGDSCNSDDTDGTSTEWTNPFSDSCTATVGDYRDCMDAWRKALDNDPCATPPADKCDFYQGCFDTGS